MLVWNLALDFKNYKNLLQTQEIKALVLNQYQKTTKNRTYTVLKLKDENQILYTISFSDLKNLMHKRVRIYGKLAPCSFLQSMQSCFFQSFSISLLPSETNLKSSLREKINSQHSSLNSKLDISLLFKALFLADPLPQSFRNITNLTATSHLVAISGFHLGILGGVIILISKLLFKLIHKYAPYLNASYTSLAVMLIFMFGYLVLLDFSPSFLRAYLMALFGFFIFFSGLRVFSFTNLFLIVFFAICFNPRLILSLSFALSVTGVFFVLLAVRHLKKPKFTNSLLNNVIFALIFSSVIFVNMIPVAHLFFPLFSIWALLSPIISLLFTLAFPLFLMLHLIGFGGIFDGPLTEIFSLDLESISLYTPLAFFVPYALLCLLAIKFHKAYITINVLSASFLGFLCLKFFI